MTLTETNSEPKEILLTEEAHRKLIRIRQYYDKLEGKMHTFSDIINIIHDNGKFFR